MFPFWLLFINLGATSSKSQFNKTEVAKLIRTPFVLDSGEFYRDLLTIEASKSVAKFAKVKKAEVNVDHKNFLLKSNKIPPRFIQLKNFSFGRFQTDNEIFDFTDSRFLNPPEENRQNRPIVNTKNILKTFPLPVAASPLYGRLIVKPTSRPTKSSSFQFGSQVHQKLPKGLFSNQVGKTEEFLPILSNRGISQPDEFGTLVYDRL